MNRKTPKHTRGQSGSEGQVIGLPVPSWRSAPRGTLLFVLALAAFTFSMCATALAGTYVINDCPAAGSSDAGPLSVFGGGQGAKASCGGGEGDWIGPRGASMSPGTVDGVQVVAPGATTIRQAKVWWYVPHQSGGADTFALAGTNGGTLAESQTPLEQRGTPSVFTLPSGSTVLTLVDFCSNDDAGQGCSFGSSSAANLVVFGSQLTLEEDQAPSGSATGGGLTSGEALSGPQSLSFHVGDSESGVRLVQLRVDGDVVAQSDFASSCPYTNFVACPQSESGAITCNTAAAGDGRHTVELIAIDAAQNSAVLYTGAITTKNAASIFSPPRIEGAGQPRVGNELSGTPGMWSAPTGAGALSYGYQWEQCDVRGESCSPIAGASGQTYTPAATDVEHTLRLLVSARDNDGIGEATSAPTATVAQAAAGAPSTSPSPSGASPGGLVGGQSTPSASTPVALGARLRLNAPATITRTYAHRALSLSGRLLGANGAPIAGAVLDVLQQPAGGPVQLIGQVVSGPDGAFTAAIPPGTSRAIEVGYRPSRSDSSYSAEARVFERVRAGVKLTITPRRTSSAGYIVLSGQVEGPVPRHGVIVELLVHYRGSWVPFRKPRTDATGHFTKSYDFQGAIGRFPFRAEVPAYQAGFSFERGLSSVIDVATD